MKPLNNPFSQGGCFFCSPENKAGLGLSFYETETDPPELVCLWTPPATYRGFGRILHGGIQSGLFDEIMGWTTAHVTGRLGVTVSLTVDFKRPALVERAMEVRCRIDSVEGDRVNLSAEITDAEGRVCARAKGVYLAMEPERFEAVTGLTGVSLTQWENRE